MRTGLFCTYENPQKNYREAYTEQTKLVQLIEAMEMEEVWIGEHHFSMNSTGSSLFALLAYLAGQTSRLRLGSAAALLPLHNPVLVAEDVATIDILSNGRFDFGIAKGGPFPDQYRHFGITPQNARAMTAEALALVQKLLQEEHVVFHGQFFHADGIELIPKPLQQPVPTFCATSTPEMVTLAADKGWGLMAAPPFPLTSIATSAKLYRETAPTQDPRLVLIRFFHLAASKEQAVSEAASLLRPFIERMRVTTAQIQPDWTPWMVLDRLIQDSLIGTIDEVREKISRWNQELGLRSLILKPISPVFTKRENDLRIFGEQIRG